ncbi:hypothetical protein D3C87_732280 [compost metagenome]
MLAYDSRRQLHRLGNKTIAEPVPGKHGCRHADIAQGTQWRDAGGRCRVDRCAGPGRHAAKHGAVAHHLQGAVAVGQAHVELAARRRQQGGQGVGEPRGQAVGIDGDGDFRHADAVAQVDVERRFHQLDIAVMHDQALAQARRHGGLATDDQQSPAGVFQRLDALRDGRLGDAQRQGGLVETAMTGHGVQHGQRAIIE